MDQFEHLKGCTSFSTTHQSISGTQANGGLKPMEYKEKEAAVHEEMERVNRLPPNSTYASHRMRILKKILQLLSIQRTMSQEQELELLFAGLSI